MSDEPSNNDQTGLSEPLPINTTGSEPLNMPPEPLESPMNADIPIPLNNDNPENTTILTKNPEVLKPEVLPAEGGKTEEITKPLETPETQTAQTPPNEPLKSESEPLGELEAKSVSNSGGMSEAKSEPEKINSVPIIVSNKNKVFELLARAKNAIQFRKRKKLDKVMTMFAKQTKITNDEVEKFLHVSDATAERYLNILEKENKIKQVGKTGHAVSYTKI
jgi:hypothetical protein